MGKEQYPVINKEIIVGSICKTNKDGDVEVLRQFRDEKGSYLCEVRFIQTGNVYTPRKDSLAKGIVKDKNKCRTTPFIEKAKSLHGDRYDYSKTVYKNSTTKITVTCPVHGDFTTHPVTHLSSTGCPKCSMEAVADFHRKTTEWFVEKAREQFGDEHDYSLVEYVDTHTPVKIVCKKHGLFEAIPAYYFTRKTGCSQCAEEIRAKEYAISFEEFVERSRAKHGDKYTYHREDYKYIKEKTRVTCPEHGDWWIVGIHHTRGVGCAKCAGVALKDTETFIEQAREVHGSKYDYSKTQYTLNKNKVEIICPEHGSFWQAASSHLSGSGCSACGFTGFDQTSVGSFYVLSSRNMVKVGITNRDTTKRLKELNRKSPESFRIVQDIGLDGWQCRELETRMLRWLAQVAQPVKETFEGSSECFNFIDELTVVKKAVEMLEEISG